MNYRIIHSDNGTLKDLSHSLNKYTSGSEVIPLSASEDYLYIGSRYPFNSIYFIVKVANSIATSMSIDYWDGNVWKGAIETTDLTDGFKSNGKISFVPSKQYGWQIDDTVHSNDTTEEILGLGGVVIYDHYWIRIKMSADLSPLTELSWCGMLFAEDADLFLEYPFFDSASIKTAYKAGKTDWQDQFVVASGAVVDDLVSKRIIEHQSQILDTSKLKRPTVAKVAQIIYKALGDDYNDEREAASKEYYSRLNKSIFHVDENNNARLDDEEKGSRQGFCYR